MKTKEDILDELTEGRKGLFNDDVQVSFDDSIKAMQEYADQQTEQLKKQLEEKEKEIERLKKQYDEVEEARVKMSLAYTDALFKVSENEKEYKEHVEKLCRNIRILEERVKDGDKELSELKAKHKEEIIKFSEFLKDYEYIMSLGLKYGAYVNKNEVDIYVNGSELHYQNLVLNHGKSINELYEQYYTQTHGQ